MTGGEAAQGNGPGRLGRTMASTDGSTRRHVLHDVREEVEAAQAALLADLQANGYDQASCFAIRLALEEAMVNAFRHGNRSDPAKTVMLEWQVSPQRLTIHVEDQGPGFDPGAVPDPTAEENIEIPSGRGLMLMRAYMTDVRYSETGNRVTMLLIRESHQSAE